MNACSHRAASMRIEIVTCRRSGSAAVDRRRDRETSGGHGALAGASSRVLTAVSSSRLSVAGEGIASRKPGDVLAEIKVVPDCRLLEAAAEVRMIVPRRPDCLSPFHRVRASRAALRSAMSASLHAGVFRGCRISPRCLATGSCPARRSSRLSSGDLNSFLRAR